MRRLYTIGHTRKPLRHFVTLLREAGVDAVIDVRLHNTSQLAGFSKRDDLHFLLTEGFGIGYAHHPELAPTEDLLSSYHADRDWDAYVAGFARLMAERGIPAHAAAVLERILAAQPRTLAELRDVRGIGPRKCEQFGPETLVALWQWPDRFPHTSAG